MKITGNKNWFLNLAEFEIDGKVVKEDDRYVVKDNTTLKNLVLSSTRLNAKKETSGHKHKGQEEVYMFLTGNGYKYLDEEKLSVQAGDMVLIEDGVFHKVESASDDEELYFICVLHGARHK